MISIPTTLPPGLVLLTATWLQLPGAKPRSTTVSPLRKSLYFSLISSSLKAARDFRPATLASRAYESLPWRLFHLVDDELDAYRFCSSKTRSGRRCRCSNCPLHWRRTGRPGATIQLPQALSHASCLFAIAAHGICPTVRASITHRLNVPRTSQEKDVSYIPTGTVSLNIKAQRQGPRRSFLGPGSVRSPKHHQ